MMSECVHRSSETVQNIEIWRLGCECHCGGGKGGFAIESGAGENGAGQKMGKWLQGNFVTQPRVKDAGAGPDALVRAGEGSRPYVVSNAG